MKKISAIFLLVLTLFLACNLKTNITANAQSSAQSMIVINAENNQILLEQNAYQKLAMASTTKIVTAITVLEYCRLNDIVKVDVKAVGIEGSSIYLQKDEELTVLQVLYGLMLQSGNDCAAALAIHCAGSVEEFAKLMNKVAIKAGAEDSNFVTPHGLDHKDHYTTAYDLAVISAYAMKNEDFRQIVGTKRVEIPWQGRDYNRVVVNKNKILNQYVGGNGIKTGYTKKAGRCLVSSAKRGDLELICVVL
ncbi:MAG: D-alanyl-D-alanine carboxypeptidase, partial [Firmicutes bacterium]|nr:D-alanyl-D-alanine carboxypeptidase [Bacillota bacterium]